MAAWSTERRPDDVVVIRCGTDCPDKLQRGFPYGHAKNETANRECEMWPLKSRKPHVAAGSRDGTEPLKEEGKQRNYFLVE